MTQLQIQSKDSRVYGYAVNSEFTISVLVGSAISVEGKKLEMNVCCVNASNALQVCSRCEYHCSAPSSSWIDLSTATPMSINSIAKHAYGFDGVLPHTPYYTGSTYLLRVHLPHAKGRQQQQHRSRRHYHPRSHLHPLQGERVKSSRRS